MLYADLDDFKLINDNFGHGVGDRLLVEVARRLRRVTRAGDIVARQGGDEFLILVTGGRDAHASAAEATAAMRDAAGRIAAKLRDALTQPFLLGDVELYVTASVGREHLSRRRRLGRDAAEARRRRAVRGEGRRPRRLPALPPDRPRPQPRAQPGRPPAPRRRGATSSGCTTSRWSSLRDRRIVGAEALIRWNDPERGLLAPADFLPIAERTGLIRPITDWVVDEACRQSREWRNGGHDLFVSVNLPPAFWRPTAMRQVMSTIDAFGLNADRMMMEITEQAAMAPVADLEPVLAELHARGLRLAIDDFGTGHSSLGRLSQLQVNTLKIDRSFIADVPADHGASILVETMITLARNLGLQCLAEGIETEEQLAFLIAPRLPARPGLPVRPAGARGRVHGAPRPPARRSGLTPRVGPTTRDPRSVSRCRTASRAARRRPAGARSSGACAGRSRRPAPRARPVPPAALSNPPVSAGRQTSTWVASAAAGAITSSVMTTDGAPASWK